MATDDIRDPATRAAQLLDHLATAIKAAPSPEEAARLLAAVFAPGGVLDQCQQLLSSVYNFIDPYTGLEPADAPAAYDVKHAVADTADFLADQADELRNTPRTVHDLRLSTRVWRCAGPSPWTRPATTPPPPPPPPPTPGTGHGSTP